MKKGFRILAAMLCVLMLIPTLAACGGNGEGGETEDGHTAVSGAINRVGAARQRNHG